MPVAMTCLAFFSVRLPAHVTVLSNYMKVTLAWLGLTGPTLAERSSYLASPSRVQCTVGAPLPICTDLTADDHERRQHPRPLAPSRERAFRVAAPDEHERQGLPRGAPARCALSSAVSLSWPLGTPVWQGIHDIALMLGIEASRDLEEQPFQGVRAAQSMFPGLAHAPNSNRPSRPSPDPWSSPG